MAKKRINRKPKPGVYEGIPYEVYDSWPYVNHSSLRHAMRSAAHYQWAMDNHKTIETEQLRFGKLLHAVAAGDLDGVYIFDGPEWLDLKHTRKRPRATEAWKRFVRRIQSKHGKVEVYTGDEYEIAQELNRVIGCHGVAASYLAGSRREVSIVWDDMTTKIRCKARLDAVTNDGITDIKTTMDASIFDQFIRRFHYYRQLAFYRDGWAHLNGGELLEARLIAAESTPFYGIRAAPLSEKLLLAGREEYEVALTRIARAIDSDRWEGYQSPDQWDSDMKTAVTVWIDGEEHTW